MNVKNTVKFIDVSDEKANKEFKKALKNFPKTIEELSKC